MTDESDTCIFNKTHFVVPYYKRNITELQ